MKITVTLKVEIDPEKYRAEYAEPASAAEIREYVKDTARDALAYQFERVGLEAKVEVA